MPARALLVLLSHDICALIICNQGRSLPENTGLPEMLQQAMCPYMMCELRREEEGSGCTETCHLQAHLGQGLRVRAQGFKCITPIVTFAVNNKQDKQLYMYV